MAAPFLAGTGTGQLVGLTFMQDNVAASQTDVQLTIAEVAAAAGNAVDEYTMPWDGEVVGVSFKLSAAGTTGAFTIGATINGTEDTDTTITVGTSTSNYKRVGRGQCEFTAGQRIGAEITTAAGWDGTTADLGVTVWCLVNLDGV